MPTKVELAQLLAMLVMLQAMLLIEDQWHALMSWKPPHRMSGELQQLHTRLQTAQADQLRSSSEAQELHAANDRYWLSSTQTFLRSINKCWSPVSVGDRSLLQSLSG